MKSILVGVLFFAAFQAQASDIVITDRSGEHPGNISSEQITFEVTCRRLMGRITEKRFRCPGVLSTLEKSVDGEIIKIRPLNRTSQKLLHNTILILDSHRQRTTVTGSYKVYTLQ